MERRDVLKLAGATAALGSTGCATMLSGQGAPFDIGAFLGKLDAGLTGILTRDAVSNLIPAAAHDELKDTPKYRHGKELIQKTMRSLLLVGSLHDMPQDQLAHPGVQQRLRDSMGEFNDSMLGMTAALEGMSKTERADIAQALRDDPQLGMRVMGAIDEEAAGLGISSARRVHLRSLAAQVCSRLRQSPDLLIEEYVGKMRKVEARHGAQAEAERRAAHALGEQLLFPQGVLGSALGQASGGTSSPPPLVPAEGDPRPPPGTDDGKLSVNPGTPVLVVGGVVLGLGAATFGIGFAVSGVGGAFIATLGAIVGILGIVGMIIGLIVFLVNIKNTK